MTLFTFIWAVLMVVLFCSTMLTSIPIMVWIERRASAFMQDRLGPNRVGPMGLLQPIADVIKLLFKEEVIPDRADKFFFVVAPAMAFIPSMLACVVIPFSGYIEYLEVKYYLSITDLNVGMLYLSAVASLAIFGIILGGWSGGSKYGFLGSLRASAQMISYELALGLSIIGVIMISGSINLREIVAYQADGLLFGFLPNWGIFVQPLGFIIFFIAIYAETNRTPFDIPEGESEIVAGYFTEYSSMKFSMYFMSEYVAMAVWSAVIVTLFFGGFELPYLSTEVLYANVGSLIGAIVQFICFIAKMGVFLFTFVWVRWTLPRFRYDQLMHLGWKVLLPLGLLNVALTGLIMSVMGMN